MDWFNNRRLLEPIGNIPPAEFEMAYYRQIKESTDAAWLKTNSLRKTQDDSNQINIAIKLGLFVLFLKIDTFIIPENFN